MAGQETVMRAFEREHNRRMGATNAQLQSYAAEMGNWMRQNARWTDRTANARNSLEAIVSFQNDTFALVAKGGGPPDYVVFLELANAGKYAIVRPCIEAFCGRIYQDLKRIWQ